MPCFKIVYIVVELLWQLLAGCWSNGGMQNTSPTISIVLSFDVAANPFDPTPFVPFELLSFLLHSLAMSILCKEDDSWERRQQRTEIKSAWGEKTPFTISFLVLVPIREDAEDSTNSLFVLFLLTISYYEAKALFNLI